MACRVAGKLGTWTNGKQDSSLSFERPFQPAWQPTLLATVVQVEETLTVIPDMNGGEK
jgi:hypothetical protein